MLKKIRIIDLIFNYNIKIIINIYNLQKDDCKELQENKGNKVNDAKNESYYKKFISMSPAN
jgi:hypothetical protein